MEFRKKNTLYRSQCVNLRWQSKRCFAGPRAVLQASRQKLRAACFPAAGFSTFCCDGAAWRAVRALRSQEEPEGTARHGAAQQPPLARGRTQPRGESRHFAAAPGPAGRHGAARYPGRRRARSSQPAPTHAGAPGAARQKSRGAGSFPAPAGRRRSACQRPPALLSAPRGPPPPRATCPLPPASPLPPRRGRTHSPACSRAGGRRRGRGAGRAAAAAEWGGGGRGRRAACLLPGRGGKPGSGAEQAPLAPAPLAARARGGIPGMMEFCC